MDINDHSKLYNAYYYSHGCGQEWGHRERWFHYIDAIADRIVSDIQPATALDAGCAMGHLVGALRHKGVQAFGLDLSEYAVRNVSPETKSFCWVGSVTEPFPQKYDLIICVEVLEHLPRVEAERAVKNLCQHTEDVLFSSTPFDYKEATHFNVQPPDYWVELFIRQSFFHDLDFDATFITPWAMRFRRQSALLQAIIRDYERHLWQLWRENADLRNSNIEARKELASSDATVQHLEQQMLALRAKIDDLEQSAVQQQLASPDKQGPNTGRFASFIKHLFRRMM